MTPKVSVVMTVYNSGKYLAEAIESILNQSYQDFEFIIIDDGSTDNSADIIRSYKDARIIFKSRSNKGQTASLNEAITMAKGVYLARQDGDDISATDRLQKQVEFLDDHPDVGLLGTNYNVIYEDGKPWFTTNLFTDPDDIKIAMIFANQLGHGTAMINKKVFAKSGVYDESFRVTQDYDLWSRIARVSKIANLKEPLYDWRYYENSLSTGNAEVTHQEMWRVRNREFAYYLKNKSKFRRSSRSRLFSTLQGPKKYLELKAKMYNNLAALYAGKKLRWAAAGALFRSISHAPWRKSAYIALGALLINKDIQYDE